MEIKVYTDGASRGNPGNASIGVVIKDGDKIVEEIGAYIGKTTNNMAEYRAVVEALRWIISQVKSPLATVDFFLDSKLVVNQLSGIFKIKNYHLRNLIVKVRQLEREIGGNVAYHFIPRTKNQEADTLINQSLDKKRS